MAREAKIGISIAVVLGLLLFLLFIPFYGFGESAEPEQQSADVVQAFRDAGLEVGASYPIEEDPKWGTGLVPKTYKEATRFELGDHKGDVFTYKSRADLNVMKDYWESFNKSGGMFYTHIYVKGNTLVRLDGQLPKPEAERYGEVLESFE